MTEAELKARVAIADRLGRIALAGDARKADDYAACFTEDGVLDLGKTVLEGRAAIRRWMASPSTALQGDRPSPGFISHHVTSSRIDLAGPDDAVGRSYFLVTSAAGIDHNGYYDDVFRQENDAWLIARRKPRTVWISPASVLGG
jgi:hypothetical protein